MKRKLDDHEKAQNTKRSQFEKSDIKSAFRSDIFNKSTIDTIQQEYQISTPYPHAVVSSLINDSLLRSVRNEIITHISFTLKETDIYRIYQSGDLANLSNLDTNLLKHLPNLVELRNALYSYDFREWISTITGAGKVSGKKTDMAVNIYTPGSYLLCHDDVIGSRRVSYILYLTDPDKPWQAEWGGGLRLYSTEKKRNKKGEYINIPLAEHNLTIPPAFGQLSFFAVKPGGSYHDVEEVYHGKGSKDERTRMAISGWYHIPQEGEEGYEDGQEEKQIQNSSLNQLKGAADEFDEPKVTFQSFDEPRKVMDSHAQKIETDPGDESDQDEDILTEQDLTFLLHYISPSFLTPDMIEEFAQSFEDTSVLQLDQFLTTKIADEVKSYIHEIDGQNTRFKDHPSRWKIARPPHKHRYSYLLSSESRHREKSPISRLLADLIHSHAFKKWLALVTGLKSTSLIGQNAIARRFRRGHDYALASPFQGDQPQLEFTISITPSTGWEVDTENPDNNKTNGNAHSKVINGKLEIQDHIEFGAEEVYMAGDEDDESIHSKSLPQVGKKADPAIYKSTNTDEDDDGILFTNSPSWNMFSVVLRDKGTLRFVKYVSQAANGDRWDIKGEVQLSDDAFDGEDSQIEQDLESLDGED